MAKDRIDINLGCGHAILSFFLGLIGFVIAVGIVVFVLLALLFS